MATKNCVGGGNRIRSNQKKAVRTFASSGGSNGIYSKIPRGGDQEITDSVADVATTAEHAGATNVEPEKMMSSAFTSSSIFITKLVGVLSMIGKSYSYHLESRPILTKSITAGIIFGLSDYLAQCIEGKSDGTSSDAGNVNGSMVASRFDWTRLLATTLVGLLYFGPAAHYWYEWIFRLFPSTSLLSTMYKAFWGQVLFGPSFTCIFFATSLLQAGDFSLQAWWRKIRTDLPGAWVAGVGYWPIIDLFSYSIVPVKLIPLFINMASLVWTIYLSLVANKGGRGEASVSTSS
jgi:protein Mpv17